MVNFQKENYLIQILSLIDRLNNTLFLADFVGQALLLGWKLFDSISTVHNGVKNHRLPEEQFFNPISTIDNH